MSPSSGVVEVEALLRPEVIEAFLDWEVLESDGDYRAVILRAVSVARRGGSR